MNSSTMKSCLMLILSEEINRINSYINNNIMDSNESCIVNTFLKEKLKVLYNALEKI